jgi:hypothetical protein
MKELATPRLRLRAYDETDASFLLDMYRIRTTTDAATRPRPPRPSSTTAFASGVEFVVALTLAENVASQRVCRRLAMHDLGTTDRYYGGASLRLFRVQGVKLSRL